MDKRRRLEEESIPKLLWEYSIPALAGSLVYILYNIVDRIFISFGVGRLAIAGLSITLPLFTLILATGLFVGMGGGSLISISLGARKEKYAEKILGNAIALFVIIGIIFSVTGLAFLDEILSLFGATPNNITYAKSYMSIIFFASPFQLMFIGMNHIIRGEGNPKTAKTMSIIGCGLNIVLDPLFIFVFGMGIKGAALATVISNVIAAFLQLYHFVGGKSKITFRVENLKLDFTVIKEIASIGVAPFIMQMSNSIVVIFINKNLNIYGGDIAIAAFGIINSLSTLFFMPLVGIYQGSQPILGFNYGAGIYSRVREAYKISLRTALLVSATGFIMAMFIPNILISPFIKNDPELFTLTENALRIFFSMVLFMGFHTIGGSYFQAVGKAKITTLINMLRQFGLMLPMLYFLPKYFGLKGVWMAAPVTDFILAVFTSYFVFSEFKRLKELPVTSKEQEI
ncbi:MATE family efflux transporter [uncultured Ilyobacter sp.]|uniref:MATE family efflux transporter n=1 Tax=uncultured Ilyobacter sp. TaxID=544433 RepID=UPI002AA8C64B|nr:MATE family efflux transporter [uncultured Ilyobacter sp.]